MEALLLSFGAVFVAELGDKSQLVTLTFAARGRPLAVLGAVSVAAAVLHAGSVVAGTALRTALPERALEIGGGLAFLVVAAVILAGVDGRGDRPDAGTTPPPAPRSLPLAAGGAFLVAELGDKTMLATIALASAYGALGTWAGATLGTVVADGLAVAVGHQLGTHLPLRTLRLATVAAFAGVGALLVVVGA
ncbi:MAG: TMEM165/GDT1 family protein [Acidimicrobiales bacterium]